MNVNAERIRQLRERRAWSQEHLAAAAGLGVRTIQRIEAEGNASAESRMAIAAAFGVGLETLDACETAGAATLATAAPAVKPAAPSFHLSWGQYHVLVFLAVSAFMLMLDMSQNHGISWSRWPVIGWGLMLMLRWLRLRFVVEPWPCRGG
ncbi:XRE family transcriptional regulator [Paludibacterium yongneupense]|uniref:XRE family transcriptional regulator n=1 Tax=Paludibacterium yongneupense TaxID=400061 RepID=UPI0003FD418E|nr:XRE family transcriptional regulator [Paludibacterium yongneupense]